MAIRTRRKLLLDVSPHVERSWPPGVAVKHWRGERRISRGYAAGDPWWPASPERRPDPPRSGPRSGARWRVLAPGWNCSKLLLELLRRLDPAGDPGEVPVALVLEEVVTVRTHRG